MYLTKLEIFGFKSFAQKVALKFDQGLTGIIGPNGCGKSNVVDSIRWVLGEQRPSVLRCDRMDNLIFNGTATSKPLGLAEVSMDIENNRNILPSEYTEVKLTRRLDRNGDSEYLINNQTVRLMDILNLFTDTGMGADAYSVIELKMVEQILSDNAQERRRLFEEAAGIKKYKARRKSALNKLDTTQQELTRLDDIIAEVQKAVNSLSRQVGKARRYHEYKQQLKENELVLSHLKMNSYQNQLKPLRAELEQVGKTKNTLGSEIHKMEASLEKLQAQSVEMEQAYRGKASILYRKDESIQELQNRRQLRKQRIESLEEATATYHQEIAFQKGKIQQLAEEKAGLQTALDQTRKSMAEAQERYRESANRQLEAETLYQKARDEYQRFVQTNLQELQKSAGIKEAHQKILIEKENLVARISRQEENASRFAAELKEREQDLHSLEKSLTAARGDQEMYRQEYSHLEQSIGELQERRENLRNEININEGRLEKARNRKDFLENLIKNYEGFSESVQYVMSRKAEYAGVVDTLANLVDCEPEFRPALESYLAEVSNYLVVEAVDTARDILKHMRSNEKGRLTLVPLSLLNANHKNGNLQLPPSNGRTTPLQEIVSYPASYSQLFDFLFHSVYLVPDLETAIDVRGEYPELTCITREGEILESWGNLTGGSSANHVGLIGRKEQYEKVIEKFETLQNQLAAQKTEYESMMTSLEEKETKRREFEGLLESTQKQSVEIDKKVNLVHYETKRLQETMQEIEEEVAALNQQIKDLEAREQALQPELQQREEKLAAYQSQEKSAQEHQRETEAQLKEITKTTQEFQITYLNLGGQEKEGVQKLEFNNQGRKEAENFIADREQRILDGQSQIEILQKEVQQIEIDLKTLYKERDEAEKQKDKTEREFNELKSAIQLSEGELKKRQRLWNQARERVQELELHIKELDVKLSGIQEQIQEKYGAAAPDFNINELDPATSIDTIQQEIETLRYKLERLGDVNPLAIKEHEKEKERLDFLESQRADLLDARDQLVETISKLNDTARKQFMEVFEKIHANFQRVFKEFFEGGEAELSLIESRDPLEANIDIAVTHKGKRLNTLTLLSAGEKTLTAISLLFAIYLVKPSPFCILDEVDAPLDDVNIGRFTQALNLFARDTQFILVTHNKKTMEAAKSLYGVTMEEVGVSKVVSVRFD